MSGMSDGFCLPRLFAVVTLVVGTTIVCSSSPADSNENVHFADEVIAIVGGMSADESTFLPILASDFRLELNIVMILESGARWKEKTANDAMRTRAFRVLLLTKSFAQFSRLVGETANQSAVDALINHLAFLIGGEEGISELLAASGASRSDLNAWAADRTLAASRMLLFEERVEPPSDEELVTRFALGGHPFTGEEFSEVKRRFRRWVIDQSALKLLDEEVKSLLKEGRLRLIN